MSIINNNLFKFLFFDQYLYNNEGGDSLIMANEFALYLNICFDKNLVPKTTSLLNFVEKFIDMEKYRIIMNKFHILIKEKTLDNVSLYKIFNENNTIILLSGWMGAPSGHAVAIYITQIKNDDRFNVYIINSGMGLSYHINENIIIMYDNVNYEDIIKIIKINYFFNYIHKNIRDDITMRKELLRDYSTNSKKLTELGLIYDSFTIIKENVHMGFDKFFYKNIYAILGPISKQTPVLIGAEKQLSSSCSFYSLYYLVKLLFDNNDMFLNFINNVKDSMLSIFITNIKDDSTYNLQQSDYINTSIIILKDHMTFTGREELIRVVMKRINYSTIYSSTYDIEPNNSNASFNSILNGVTDLLSLYRKLILSPFKIERTRRLPDLYDDKLNYILSFFNIFGGLDTTAINMMLNNSSEEFINDDILLQLQQLLECDINVLNIKITMETIVKYITDKDIIYHYKTNTNLCNYIFLFRINVCSKMIILLISTFKDTFEQMNIDDIKLFVLNIVSIINFYYVNITYEKYQTYDSILFSLYYSIIFNLLKIITLDEVKLEDEEQYSKVKIDKFFEDLFYAKIEIFSLKINYKEFIILFKKYRGLFFIKDRDTYTFMFDADIKIEMNNPPESSYEVHHAITFNDSREYNSVESDINLKDFYLEVMKFDNMINSINNNTINNNKIKIVDFIKNNRINYNLFLENKTIKFFLEDLEEKWEEEDHKTADVFKGESNNLILKPFTESNCIYDLLYIPLSKLDIKSFIENIDKISEDNLNLILVLLKILMPDKLEKLNNINNNIRKDSAIYNIINNVYYNDMFYYFYNTDKFISDNTNIDKNRGANLLQIFYEEIFMESNIDIDKFEKIIIDKITQLKDNIKTINSSKYGKMIQYIDSKYNLPFEIYTSELDGDNLYLQTDNNFIEIKKKEEELYIYENSMKIIAYNKNNYSSKFINVIGKIHDIGIPFIFIEEKLLGKKLFSIYIPEFDCFFIDNIKCGNIIFQNKNKKQYILKFTSQYTTINIWLLHLKNGFLLYDMINSKYKLLLFSSDKFLRNNMEPYWYDTGDNIKLYKVENNITVLDFHMTNLCFDIISNKDFVILFTSLCLSKNYIATSLLRSRLCNIRIDNSDNNDNSDNSNITKNLINMIQGKIVDIPNWPILLENTSNNYTKYYHINQMLINDRKKFFITDFIPVISETFDITKMTEYNIIKKICDTINMMDKTKLSDKIPIIVSKILSRYKCKKYEYNYEDPRLIKKRYAVKETSTTKTSMDNNKLDEIYNNLISTNMEITENRFDDDNILRFIISSNLLPSPYILYYIFHEYFYKKLVGNIFNDIIKFFNSYNKKMALNLNYSCGFILKQMEGLDPYIIDFTMKKSYTTIIFEIHTKQFIRKEQHNMIDYILNDTTISAFEILMGKGKTSTITPYLILHNNNLRLQATSENTENTENSVNSNYHIILPSHLVISSYTIMNKMVELFNKISITTNDMEFYANNNMLYVRIHSDSMLKSNILNLRIKTGNFKIPQLFNDNSFCIFDEIDNMINPLKSNLNIPILPFISHPYNDILISSISILASILFGSRKQININSKTSTIYINKTEIKTKLEENIISIIVDKLVFIKNKINSMFYNKHYGFRNMDIIDLIDSSDKYKNYFIAIPYNGNHNPVNGSEFSDFELSLLLTYMSYYKHGLRIEDIKLLIFYIATNYYKKNTYNNIYITVFFPRLIEIIGEKLFLDTLFYYGEPSCEKNYYIIYDKYNKLSDAIKIEIINIYIKDVIFKLFFTIPLKQYNISTVDLLGKEISSNKICFSGTVNYNTLKEIEKDISYDMIHDMRLINESLQLYSVKNDTLGQDFIKASIYGVIYKPTIYKYDEYDKENELLIFIKTNLKSYQALIDTAGLIINKKPREVIDFLYEKDSTRTYLYISNGVRTIYNPDISLQLQYNNELFYNLFIYYDNKNCVGIDFIQPYTMNGLVTINQTNNLTEISQGIFRLRNINIGHTVNFFISDRITEDIYNMLVRNDKHHKDNCKQLMILQYIKYYDRMINYSNIEKYIEPIYYETLPLTLLNPNKVLPVYNMYDSSDEEDEDTMTDTKDNKKHMTYNQFVENMIKTINHDNNLNKKAVVFKMIEMQPHILLDITSTNIAISTNIVTVEKQTEYINTFSCDLNLPDIDTDNIDIYFKMIQDTNLFNYNKLNGSNLLTIGNTYIKISPHVLIYYKEKFDLYYIVKKEEEKIFIFVITFFELLLLQMSANKFLNNINIYDRYGTCIHNKFSSNIPIYITFLLFESKQNMEDVINSINFLYNRTKNTKDIIEFCKYILNNNININPCDNSTFNTGKNSSEFWANLLNINMSNNFNTLIKKIFSSNLQLVEIEMLNPMKKLKPSISTRKGDLNLNYYNKYLKYKNKYIELSSIYLKVI